MTTPEGDSRPLCPYCGGEDLVDGSISGQHRARFNPTGKKWTRAGAPLHGTACLGCGGLWIWVEAAEVRRALGR